MPIPVAIIEITVRPAIAEAVPIVPFAMVTIISVIVFVLINDRTGENHAPANRWGIRSDRKFSEIEPAYQTE